MAGSSQIDCPVCAHPAVPAVVEKDGYAFAQCAGCEYLFLDPPLAPDVVGRLYRNVEDDTWTDPKIRSRYRRALIRAFRLRRHVSGRRALDLGCGTGSMADAMRRFGADAVGVDTDARAIQFAQRRFPGTDFRVASAPALAGASGPFDFVYCSELIEHVPDLAEFMDGLAALARPGGLVYITTPDCGSPRRPAALADWEMVAPPIHIRLFNAANLTSLFERYGFGMEKRFRDRKTGLKVLFRKA